MSKVMRTIPPAAMTPVSNAPVSEVAVCGAVDRFIKLMAEPTGSVLLPGKKE